MCDQLGEAWQPKGEKLDDVKLAQRAVGSGFRLGQVPGWVLALVAGIDLQTDAAYVTIRGFGEYGLERCLVWRERVPCPVSIGLAPLDHLLYQTRFKRTDGKELGIGARFFDSGDRTKEVYDYCRKRLKCWPVKGRPSMQNEHSITTLDKWPDGTPMPGGIQLLNVNTHHWKSEVMRLLRVSSPDTERPEDNTLEGASLGPVGRWHFPEDTGDEYFSQITSEECRKVVKGSTAKYEWVVRPGRENHYFDGEVYIEAGFHAIGGHKTLRRMVAGAAPQPERKAEKPWTHRNTSGSSLARRIRDRRNG
jgi:phage terminase large subunit GpA-like protein